MAIGPDDLREEDLLREAQAVIRPLPAREPRAGFAAMVALNARDRRGSSFAGWLRWSFGGLAVAGAAAVAGAPALPAPRHEGSPPAPRPPPHQGPFVGPKPPAPAEMD